MTQKFKSVQTSDIVVDTYHCQKQTSKYSVTEYITREK